MRVERFVPGERYRLTQDYVDVIYGLVKKGTILIYTGKNLGYAKFQLPNKNEIAVKPRLAFNIFEVVEARGN